MVEPFFPDRVSDMMCRKRFLGQARRSGTLGGVSTPASRTDAVLNAIRRAILTRELVPGQPLVEMEPAQRLGVSKTPVREALKLLSGPGLVTFGLSILNSDFHRALYGGCADRAAELPHRHITGFTGGLLTAIG